MANVPENVVNLSTDTVPESTVNLTTESNENVVNLSTDIPEMTIEIEIVDSGQIFVNEAKSHADRAEASASNANETETSVLQAEQRVKAYETDASKSSTAAHGSYILAQRQAINAENSATSASESATNAANSATSASESATNAANSATSASASATSASESATSAETSATNVSDAEIRVLQMKYMVEDEATAAYNSMTAAKQSETDARMHSYSAEYQASVAEEEAVKASVSSMKADTSAKNAATSATSASESATSASTSATAAATSATAAATSATNAETARTGAETARDEAEALIPAEGTAGQFLQKTETGTKWTSSTGVTAWGDIIGTMSNQTDLQTALDSKITNPTGTAGQYLKKTETATEWATVNASEIPATGGTVQGSLDSLNTGISTLNTNVGDLTTDVSTLTTDVDALTTTVSGKITNPDNGTKGQLLRKTATGEEWATVSASDIPATGNTTVQRRITDIYDMAVCEIDSDPDDIDYLVFKNANGEALGTILLDDYSIIAMIEKSPATASHAVGSYIVRSGGRLYRVTSAISKGQSLIVGTNITSTTVGEELTALNNDLTNYISSVSFTGTTNTAGYIEGAIGVFGLPSKAVVLSAYFERGSYTARRMVNYYMYGNAGIGFQFLDNGSPVNNGSVTATIYYVVKN